MILNILRLILSTIRGEQNIKKLKRRGLKVGVNLKIMNGVIIDPSHCWHITIGDNVTLAPNVHILAHDASTKVHLNVTKVSNVSIGDNVFIGAGSIILPGVSIGDNTIIGSGSVVTKSVPPNSVAAGNPSKVIMSLDEYLRKEQSSIIPENCFDESYTLRSEFSIEKKNILLNAVLAYGKIYIE